MNRTVKYWKRLGMYLYEPHSCTIKERDNSIDKEKEAWCIDCQAVVEFETGLDALGLYNKCPFCGRRF